LRGDLLLVLLVPLDEVLAQKAVLVPLDEVLARRVFAPAA